jgi:hypothetical protein
MSTGGSTMRSRRNNGVVTRRACSTLLGRTTYEWTLLGRPTALPSCASLAHSILKLHLSQLQYGLPLSSYQMNGSSDYWILRRKQQVWLAYVSLKDHFSWALPLMGLERKASAAQPS